MSKSVYRVEFENFSNEEFEEVRNILFEKHPEEIFEVPVILLDAGYITMSTFCAEEKLLVITKIRR
ncbi:hypothetical protein [Anaerotignum sp.]